MFDTVRLDVGIGKQLATDTTEWDDFVAKARIDLGYVASSPAARKVLQEMHSSDTSFAQALILAREDGEFRRYIALDIIKKAERATTPDESGNYRKILAEVALLRASGSSLLGEIEKGSPGKKVDEEEKKDKQQENIKHDVDFLVQMPFALGLFNDQKTENAAENLNSIFEKFYDERLRQAVLFDAVEQIITGDGRKTDSNLMVVDVSELLINEDTGFQEKYGKFMVTFLTYLAAKLESAPESIKGRIALVSNHSQDKAIDDKELLNNLARLVRIYPGLDSIASIFGNKKHEKKIVMKPLAINEQILKGGKISIGALVTLLDGREGNITSLEVMGLKPKEHLIEDLQRKDITLRIIDLMTNATVEIQEELKATRFVTIQA